jgi:hypothetical protein
MLVFKNVFIQKEITVLGLAAESVDVNYFW